MSWSHHKSSGYTAVYDLVLRGDHFKQTQLLWQYQTFGTFCTCCGCGNTWQFGASLLSEEVEDHFGLMLKRNLLPSSLSFGWRGSKSSTTGSILKRCSWWVSSIQMLSSNFCLAGSTTSRRETKFLIGGLHCYAHCSSHSLSQGSHNCVNYVFS